MQEILDGIQAAIEDERRAQEHYRKLSEQAEEPEVKQFFELLRRDEENHEKILLSRYNALAKGQSGA